MKLMTAKVIKFSHKLPYTLEHKMITKMGWFIQSRDFQKSITMQQFQKKPLDLKPVVAPPAAIATLLKRCDNIVSFFPDPYAAVMPVRQRLYNMMNSLSSDVEKQFVLEYMDDNFPIE